MPDASTDPRTIRANDGKRIEMSDHSPLSGDVARVVEIVERYRFLDTGTNAERPFRSEWRFEEAQGDGGGTLVVRDIEFPTPRAAKRLGPIGRALAAGLVRRDLRAHCRACAKDLR